MDPPLQAYGVDAAHTTTTRWSRVGFNSIEGDFVSSIDSVTMTLSQT
jgi:hypothetical protein